MLTHASVQEFCLHNVPSVTMDKLRQVIDVLNISHRSTVGYTIRKVGRKAELVSRYVCGCYDV